MMRLWAVFAAAALCSSGVSGQTAKEHGIELGDLDRKADPCNDFYEFANGTWRAKNPIPPSQARWSRRWQAGELSKDQLKTILDEVSAKKDLPEGSVDQLIGDYYASCMDESRINKQGIAPLKPWLDDIDKIQNRAGVARMILSLSEIAIPAPFTFGSVPDFHDPSNVIANVGAAGLGLPDRDYYVKTEDRFKDSRAKYVAHVAKMFELAGYKQGEAREAADRVMLLETRLAQASLDNVALRDPAATDHKTKFEDLEKLTPDFDWSAYYKEAGLNSAALNVSEPKFLEAFNHELTSTPVEDWKTYLKWQLLNSAAGALSQPFVDANFAFYGKYLAGVNELKPRWKQCVESTDTYLGEALGKEYVARYFPPEAKARMQELVKNILLAMGDTIQGLDWMGTETKQKAMEKLATFNPKVGYPDTWKDYSHVPISRDSYWSNVVEGRKFSVHDDYSQIGKPVDRGRWGMTPPTSDAYYNPLLNEIVFPAGILQPPAFSMESIDAVNYGAIGVVIGHEISHGFDDEGAQYDAQGRLNNWWTPEDFKKFQAKAQCVVNQFDNYFVEPGIHHQGKLVLGESIGDLAGAKIAYLAFHKSLEGKKVPEKVDGFTQDQQFFIAWGQFRGDAIRPETQRLMVQSDPHPIAKYRVIGPLSNLPAFQKAFSCPANCEMVRPEGKRCEVW